MSTFQSSCSLGRRGTPGGVSITFDSYELPETESMPPLYSAHDPRQGGLIVHPVNYEEDVDAVSLSPLAALCRLPRENSSSAAEPGGKFRFAEGSGASRSGRGGLWLRDSPDSNGSHQALKALSGLLSPLVGALSPDARTLSSRPGPVKGASGDAHDASAAAGRLASNEASSREAWFETSPALALRRDADGTPLFCPELDADVIERPSRSARRRKFPLSGAPADASTPAHSSSLESWSVEPRSLAGAASPAQGSQASPLALSSPRDDRFYMGLNMASPPVRVSWVTAGSMPRARGVDPHSPLASSAAAQPPPRTPGHSPLASARPPLPPPRHVPQPAALSHRSAPPGAAQPPPEAGQSAPRAEHPLAGAVRLEPLALANAPASRAKAELGGGADVKGGDFFRPKFSAAGSKKSKASEHSTGSRRSGRAASVSGDDIGGAHRGASGGGAGGAEAGAAQQAAAPDHDSTSKLLRRRRGCGLAGGQVGRLVLPRVGSDKSLQDLLGSPLAAGARRGRSRLGSPGMSPGAGGTSPYAPLPGSSAASPVYPSRAAASSSPTSRPQRHSAFPAGIVRHIAELGAPFAELENQDRLLAQLGSMRVVAEKAEAVPGGAQRPGGLGDEPRGRAAQSRQMQAFLAVESWGNSDASDSGRYGAADATDATDDSSPGGGAGSTSWVGAGSAVVGAGAASAHADDAEGDSKRWSD